MTNRVGYLILLIYIALTFWAIMMWIDKMSKVIIGNYLVWITCFAFWNLINQWVNLLKNNPDAKFLGISYDSFWTFLWNAELILILLMFAWLIRLIYKCGRIQVSFGSNATTEKLYFIILIPITVLSFICGPYIALNADWLTTAEWLPIIQYLEWGLRNSFWFLWNFMNYLPFWMFANWLAFIIISSHINFKISLTAKTTQIPEWL